MSTVVDPLTTTQPHLPIDPRMHRRLVEVHRQEGRRRLRILLAASAAIALAGAALGSLHTSLWRVRHVRVTGASAALPTAVLLRAIGLDHRALMVDVAAAADQRRLEDLPMVGIASVARSWPATVRIAVTSRTGVAVVGAGGGREVVDRTGRVLAMGPAVGVGLPVLNAQVHPVTAGSWLSGSAGPGGAALALTAPGKGAAPTVQPSRPLAAELALAASFGPALEGQIQSVSVSPTDGLTASVGSITVIFGDANQLLSKVSGLAAVLAHGSLSGVTRIDLSVPDRPALSGGGSGTSSPAGGQG